MAHFKHIWKFLLFFFVLGPVLADVQPISLTVFGLYGSPVQPLGLAATTTDVFGFNILGEWNPSNYGSLGLSFEQATFYFPGQSSSYSAANFEGRFFPLQNEKGSFSPYLYGGAGLGLSSSGSPQLKAGLGSRVSFIGPVYLDFAAGSHWIQSPGNIQYVDFRAGLSYSLELNPKPTSTPTVAPTTQPTVTLPGLIPTVTPAAPTTIFSAPQTIFSAPTTVFISQAPVTTLAQGKKYYKLGMKAFTARNYPLALRYLKKSLELKEKHKHAYYYAETYATIGVIWQFHAHKVPDHLQKALVNYKKALAIDPKTKSARHYYKQLKAQLAKTAKPKVAPAPTPGSASPSSLVPTPDSSASSNTISIN